MTKNKNALADLKERYKRNFKSSKKHIGHVLEFKKIKIAA